MEKYDFTGKTIEHHDKILRQIIRLSDGLIGGYIESEKNLSQLENCFVYNDAKVYSNAEVYENAKIYNDAEVYGNTKVYENAEIYGNAEVYGNTEVKKGTIIGDVNCNFDDIIFVQCENRLITIYKKDNEYYCNIGCQYNMTLKMLKKRIEEDGGIKSHRKRYIKLMENIKNIM